MTYQGPPGPDGARLREGAYRDGPVVEIDEEVGRLELREERLTAETEMRELGTVEIRTAIEERPASLDVYAEREEVEVQHVPVGQTVTERMAPWEEGDVMVIPVYEEQLVVLKRLVMKEQIRVRRVVIGEHQQFQDTVRVERLDVVNNSGDGLVHERYPSETGEGVSQASDGGILGRALSKIRS